MFKIGSITFNFNKVTLAVLALLLFIFLYPKELTFGKVVIINSFIKTRVVSIGIVFLILRGIVHEYYLTHLMMLFLVILLLAPTLNFGQLLIATLVGVGTMRILKKM